MMNLYLEITFLVLVIGFTSAISSWSSGITRDSRILLPGNEKISRRSIEHPIFKRAIYGGSKHGFRPLPVFGKRSVGEPVPSTMQDFQESSESLEAAETIIFRPMFRSGLRKTRSINGLDETVSVLRKLRDVSKQNRENNPTDADLDAAETIIFRPMFRSGLRKARSVQNAVEDLQAGSASSSRQLRDLSKQNPKEDSIETDLDVAESIIFRPMFRSGLRKTRSVKNSVGDLQVDGSAPLSRQLHDVSQPNLKNNPAEIDLDTAESIIFRPMFRSGLRKIRSVQNSVEDMTAGESGLIFRTLFRSRPGNI